MIRRRADWRNACHRNALTRAPCTRGAGEGCRAVRVRLPEAADRADCEGLLLRPGAERSHLRAHRTGHPRPEHQQIAGGRGGARSPSATGAEPLPPLRPPPRATDATGIAIGAVCVAQVFSQARALLFKAVKVRATRRATATNPPPAAAMRACAQVRRVYDEKTNSLLYISYAERLDKSDDENKSRFKTSMCVLPAN